MAEAKAIAAPKTVSAGALVPYLCEMVRLEAERQQLERSVETRLFEGQKIAWRGLIQQECILPAARRKRPNGPTQFRSEELECVLEVIRSQIEPDF
jgi:hypothetical protein